MNRIRRLCRCPAGLAWWASAVFAVAAAPSAWRRDPPFPPRWKLPPGWYKYLRLPPGLNEHPRLPLGHVAG